MMKDEKRQWQGWLDIVPEHPDRVLSRHINWEKGRKDEATSEYPEPCNLVAAAAYELLPKQLPDYALLYKDELTGLWVQAIDIRALSPDMANDWLKQQRQQGAVAIWKNPKAEPLRPKPVSKFKWEQPVQDSYEEDC